MVMSRVALFVDGANMYYAQKLNEWWIGWESAYRLFTDNRDVYGAFYFTATPAAGNKERIQAYRRFRGFLINIGFTVIDKEVREIRDRDTGELIRQKGNLDIELVFRMLSGAHQYEEAVIFGCDVDYVPIIQHLRNIGKMTTIVGRRQSTAIDLINACDKFIDLENIRPRIERKRPEKAAPDKKDE